MSNHITINIIKTKQPLLGRLAGGATISVDGLVWMVERWSGIVLIRGLVTWRNGEALLFVDPLNHPDVPLLVDIHPMSKIAVNLPNASVESVELSGELVHRRLRRRNLRNRLTPRKANPRRARLRSRCSWATLITNILCHRRRTHDPSTAHLMDEAAVLQVVWGKKAVSYNLESTKGYLVGAGKGRDQVSA